MKSSLPLLLSLIVASTLLMGCQTSEKDVTESAKVKFTPFPAPTWELKDMDGNSIHSDSLKGKVVLIDFWATWCNPCVREIPGFIALQKKYGKDGLVVIGVNIEEEPEVVKPAMKEMGVNYTIVSSTPELETQFGGVEAIPQTFIINREGKVVVKHEGFTAAVVFESQLRPLLFPKI